MITQASTRRPDPSGRGDACDDAERSCAWNGRYRERLWASTRARGPRIAITLWKQL